MIRSLTLAAVLALAACQTADETPVADAGHAAMDHAAVDPTADPDLAFIDGMTPHHAGALDMARLAPERAASPEVRALAEAVVRSQTAEADTLRAWRTRWFADAPAAASGTAMAGMDMTAMDMDALRAASGAAFDRLFLYGMIAHHAGAVPMAADAHRRSSRPEVQALAARIVRDQAREIGQMQALLDGMAPAPSEAAAQSTATTPARSAEPVVPPTATAEPAAPPAAAPAPEGRTVAVRVTDSGFEPARVSVPVGVASTLVFTRTSSATCATSVVGPALGIAETALPLGEAVRVRVMPERAGELAFACGMDMFTGVVVAQ